jgi:exodeoxyribonuclease III
MKIIAWNVNGLRSLLKTDNLDNMISSKNPDVLCFGETKLSCPLDDINNTMKEKYPQYKYIYWSPCKTRAGYSGTAILSKKEPLNVIYGLQHKGKELDDEGRVISVEYKKFWLVHVYTPNSGQELARLDFRTKEWDRAFEKHINKLQETKEVIVCGDLNVAHNEKDLKNPKANLKTAGYTIEERTSFDKILETTGLKDSFRELHPETIRYSYWSYRFNSRSKNVGWRIDYFLTSEKLLKKIKKSDILEDIMGSDHAPIILEL